MNTDPLGSRARSVLDAALDVEPRVDDATAARLRARVLGAAAGGAVLTSAASAGSATGPGAGAPLATAATLTTTAKVLAIALLAAASLAIAFQMSATRQALTPPPTLAPAPLAPAERLAAPAPTPSPPPIPVESLAPSPLRRLPTLAPTPTPSIASTSRPSPTPPDETTAFTRDLLALDRARQALAAGSPRAALTELDTTVSSTGAFAEERAALHAIALCANGNPEGGQRELARFRAAHPHSVQLGRADRACAVTEPASDGHSPR